MSSRGRPARVASVSAGLAIRPGRGGPPTRLALEVLAVVERIPRAKVASYGDVAELVGTAPRGVGAVMARYGHEVCWWRVVQASGRPTRSAPEQALAKLAAEGTPLVGDMVDLAQARWDGR